MITVRLQKNAETAKQYYQEHIGRAEYYSESHRSQLTWVGAGCERLGLVGGSPVTQEAFERLCENQHPVTGEKLTARNRTVDRRVNFDFVVSAPKSVSIMALLVGDERLIEAHELASQEAMRRMEREVQTRVRKGGLDENRTTGEFVAASVTHGTSRALDPQLHTHFVVFNITWDGVEKRWKAMQAAAMYEKIQFYTEVYRGELGSRLRALGYSLRSAPHGFEIEGVSNEIVKRYSKRRQAILAAEERVSTSLGKPLSNNTRASIAQSTRAWKDMEQSTAEILAYQRSQLTEAELEGLKRVIPKPMSKEALVPLVQEMSPEEALNYARDHLFERSSVVPRYTLLRTAMERASGRLTIDVLEGAMAKRSDFIASDDKVTTVAMLQCEREMIRSVNAQMGRFVPIGMGRSPSIRLNEDQHRAWSRVLSSPDGVQVLNGNAGAGKSQVVRAIYESVREHGLRILVLAPTQSACQSLRSQGDITATTTQAFVQNPDNAEHYRGGVLVVDEAGLLSVPEMTAVLSLAAKNKCRVVLCGDTRQHSAVRAGDALRLLEQRCSIASIELSKNNRQQSTTYRAAVSSLSAGKIQDAFSQLETMGALAEVPASGSYEALVAEYLESKRLGKTALIVAVTWKEIEGITEFLRGSLKASGELGMRETPVSVLSSLQWTEAQRRLFENYRPGMCLQFHRSTAKVLQGETLSVKRCDSGGVIVARRDGTEVRIGRKQSGCFDVMTERSLPIAAGDVLWIRANCAPAKLYNGQLVSVREVCPDGRIHLQCGRTIPPEFRVFTHGYAVTSYAAQGKTVDHVYVAMSTESLMAANYKQFYVSVSRGREKVRVFSDDLETLRGVVMRDGNRAAAVELVGKAPRTAIPVTYTAQSRRKVVC